MTQDASNDRAAGWQGLVRRVGPKWLLLGAVVLGGLLAVVWAGTSRLGSPTDPRIARVTRGKFEDVIRRRGSVSPVAKEKVLVKVRGTILKLVSDGENVEKGQTVVELDPKPHEEALANQEANLARIKADREKQRQNELKELRKAKDEVESRRLRVDLETLRLKDMELGPTATEELNAQVNLENAKNLLQARKEEYAILEELGLGGFVSQTEVRQKQLDLEEQEVAVAKAELEYKRLHTLDPVKIGEQRLKVRDEEKNLVAATERASFLAQANKQSEERHQFRQRREEQRLKELQENVLKTKVTAPVPGVALQREFWGMRLGPGREVRDGWELMTISDLRKMKVNLTVDEGRIARVVKGLRAEIRPAGAEQTVFQGVVTMVAEKGRDEFEDYLQETQDIVGKAQRQVFDVEVEIEGESPLLRPGLRVNVEIAVQRLEQALKVPRAALVREKDNQAFVRVDGALGPERKPVKVLGESELEAAIEGLDEGQRVWLVEP